jgi:nucleotide-binding universal stress UspA family protein
MVKLRRILVGIDFSEASVAAARWVSRHFGDSAEVVLAHVIDVPKPPAFLRSLLPAVEDVSESNRLAAEQRLSELAAQMPGPKVRTELRFGASAETLVALVRDIGADLVVVGGHGSRRGVLGLVGSTTEQLVRVSAVPLLVARGLDEGPPRSILAPLDPSPAAARVLAWSRMFRERFDARVTACYAVDVMQAYGRIRTVSAATRIVQVEEGLRKESSRWISDRLRAAGFAAGDAEVQVTIGDPRSAIPLLAERVDAGLVIMGSRGAGSVGRAVLGSVAGAVLSTTSYPVLIVTGGTRSK